MDSDLYLVCGLILLAFSLPSIIGALSDGRAPRAAAIVVLAGGFLTVMALNQRAYTLDDIPHAFVRVIGKYIN